MIVFIAAFVASVAAQEINIGRARIEAPQSNRIVGEQQIEQYSSQTSEDILRTVPGLTVSRSGGAGQPGAVFIRGAESAGTLVLLDGIPVNDPSLNTRGFDFSTLNLKNIEHVEVWKGPQSVFFGSGATGGVINFVTKKGNGPLTTNVGAEVGSYNTFNTNVSLRGSHERISYSLLAGRFQTNGISAANVPGGERDGAWMNTLSARLGWNPDSSLEIESLARWTGRQADLDFSSSSSGPYFIQADAIDYRAKGESLATALKAKKRWSGHFSSAVSASRFAQTRAYGKVAQPANRAWLSGHYRGEAYHLENINTWQPLPNADVFFGPTADFENSASVSESDSFSSAFARQTNSLVGLMARTQYNGALVFFTTGDRLDQHDQFGKRNSFEIAFGLHLTADLDLAFRYATAYKAPTLFELYDPSSGNRQLQPEQVAGSEISLSQFLAARRIKLQLSAFQNDYTNLIEWAQNHYTNLGSARVRGLEGESHFHFARMNVQFGYTYLNTRNNATGATLLRRPRSSINGQVDLEASDKLSLGLQYLSADRRPDLDPVSNAAMTAAAYQVLNAVLTWRRSENLKIYLRCLNVADLRYEEVAGYSSFPRSYYLGASYSLL